MRNLRRNHDSAFKAKVAVESVKGKKNNSRYGNQDQRRVVRSITSYTLLLIHPCNPEFCCNLLIAKQKRELEYVSGSQLADRLRRAV